MNIFEQATRLKLRFNSSRGLISVEELWDMPLLSRDAFNLNQLARSVNAALKTSTEDNFVPVATKPTAEAKRNLLALDIIKAVIEVKVEEADKLKAAAEKKAKRDKLIELMAKRQDEQLEKLSVEDITKQLAELDD